MQVISARSLVACSLVRPQPMAQSNRFLETFAFNDRIVYHRSCSSLVKSGLVVILDRIEVYNLIEAYLRGFRLSRRLNCNLSSNCELVLGHVSHRFNALIAADLTL